MLLKPAQAKSADINLIVTHLRAGEVVILPTDTIYGLSCLALDKRAVKRVFQIKKREANKPLINLVSSLAMAKGCAYISRQTEKNLRHYWQESNRPTTVILPAREKFPSGVVAADNSISLRLPKSEFLIKIIRKVKSPLVSTSLNLSGQAPLLDLKNLPTFFPKNSQPSLVVDSGPCRRRPSRLIDLREEKVKVIRK